MKTANGDRRLVDYIACWGDEEHVENFEQKTQKVKKKKSGLKEDNIKAVQTFNKLIWEVWSGFFWL